MTNVLKFRRKAGSRPSVVTLTSAFAVGVVAMLAYPAIRDNFEHVALPKFQTSTQFAVCGWGARQNCVIDGDTFYYNGRKIRISDIDTPETNPPRCDYEADLGAKATRRLSELLSEGPFELVQLGSRNIDRYGRELRVVQRNGRSLGDILVGEGLARTWTGRRQPWC